ncbi:MAG: anthranilate synthase component I [Alphaproteobacteria bacterium]|nr:anthranilate synthase component I [Alphaproteobacteria bacterium]
MAITPDAKTFARNWNAGKNQVVWTSYVSDLETPVSAMQKLGHGKAMPFLLESIEGGATRGRFSFIGREPDLIWRCRDGKPEINRQAATNPGTFEPEGAEPLDSLRALLSESKIDDPNQPQPMAAGLFGYLGYDMVRQMEKLPKPKARSYETPDAMMLRPSLLVIFDQIENKFTLVTPAWHSKGGLPEAAYEAACERLKRALNDLQQNPTTAPETSKMPALPAPVSNMQESGFLNMIERAKEYIRAGDIFQVVLSQRFSVPFTLSPLSLYRAVRRMDPSPFLFVFDFGDHAVVGTSPEILVRVRDNKVTVRPIAGTRPRGAGNRSDAELADELLHDEKELAEHLMLLDLGRNDIGRVAKTGTVKVTAHNTIEYYRHVMHIVSNVEAALDEKKDIVDALVAGFPAGTVSGAPKVRAMQVINELEPDARGIYAGCIGYLGVNGAMDTCIAIRTAVIKDGMLHVQAGAGIVYDSNAQAEYRETVAKASGMLKAAEEAMKFAAK